MEDFSYRDGEAFCESVPLSKPASELGTPLYVYSKASLDRRCRQLRDAFAAYPTLPCYAVKANGNLSLLKTIFSHGFGADVVSRGEMERALAAGLEPRQIVFSGVGKTDDEMEKAVHLGIRSFNVESGQELERLAAIAARHGKRAPVCLRLNPNIDAKTHPHIATGLHTTKFGIAEKEARELIQHLGRYPSLALVGLACHIGSQILELEPFRQAARHMADWALELKTLGLPLLYLNLGGGLGIRYGEEVPPTTEDYARTLIGETQRTGLQLVVEPGRTIVGNTGVLVTRVIATKKTDARAFVVADAAMTELIRPSLYDAYHEISPVQAPPANEAESEYDVVGPVCETTDFLGRACPLPAVKAGDLLFVRSTGAYGASMASNYNTRPRVPEVLVDGENYRVIRPREKLESLWASELAALSER